MANPNPSQATRFKKGQVANPHGRPPGKTLSSQLRIALEKAEKDGRTRAEVIAETLVALAIAGDFRAIQIIFERTEGKVPDIIQNVNVDAPRRIIVDGTDDRYAIEDQG